MTRWFVCHRVAWSKTQESAATARAPLFLTPIRESEQDILRSFGEPPFPGRDMRVSVPAPFLLERYLVSYLCRVAVGRVDDGRVVPGRESNGDGQGVDLAGAAGYATESGKAVLQSRLCSLGSVASNQAVREAAAPVGGVETL